MITQISIKNIKGFGDPAKVFNLGLNPNRVNIIYAPNGTGKSSIAAAFKSLRPGKLEVAIDDLYRKDETLAPELSIVMDGASYTANNTSNTLNGVLEPCVINSGTVVCTTQQNIGGRYTKVSGYLDIDNIEVIGKIPPVVVPHYRVTEIKAEFGDNSKIVENRSTLFLEPRFLKACEAAGAYLDFFPKAQYRLNYVNAILDEIHSLRGTADQVVSQVHDAWFDALEADATYLAAMQEMSEFTVGMTRLQRFDLFFQLLYFWSHSKQDIHKANKRTLYEAQRAKFDANLALLDSTWKSIKSVEEKDRLVVQFPHADEISNGQRDILTFAVDLLRFKSQMQVGKKYILLIDEVFDYLDDANTITAQYFLSKFLDLNRGNIYLCLLTHLNPFSFKNYVFSDKKVNFVYLLPTQPVATDAMKAFISFREGLDKNDAAQLDLYEKLSHDLFHYNPLPVDYTLQIAALKTNVHLIPSWGKTNELHRVLIDEVNKYLTGNAVYDPYAVSMALRLRVEKLIYDQLNSQVLKDDYVNQKMTKYKFKFAEDNGVLVPDILNVVNAIHNEADHLKYDAVSHQYLEKSMVYKLQNNVILGIMKNIFGWNGAFLTTDAID